MRSRGIAFVLATALALAGYGPAFAYSSYLTEFNDLYGTQGTRLDDCAVCHPGGNKKALTPYGQDYVGALYDLVLIQAHDSDGDGFDNLEEIEALTFPGDANDRPALANQAPVADAGPDQQVDESAQVLLDGANSTDPEGGPLDYSWVQTAGPAVAFSDPAAVNPTFVSPDVGPGGASLTFELTVTDDGGLKATDSVIVNVSWINEPPTADAGPDQDVVEGQPVALDGGNSSDPDDGIGGYLWEQVSGVAVALSDAAAAGPTFTAPEVGPAGAALVFRLTVTDGGGLKATDTVVVNVSPLAETPANLPPVADAGPEQTVEAGAVVHLDGSKSSDPDDGIAAYEWKQLAGPPVMLSDIFSPNPEFTAPDVGPGGAALTFELTVTDRGGLKSTATCIVNVSWVNQPPVADAGADQSVPEGSAVSLDGSKSSDPDDGIAAYGWKQLDGPAVSLSDPTAARPTFLAPRVEAGETVMIFELTVTDHGGLKATSTTRVTVQPVAEGGPNQPPVADAGPDQTVSAGARVVLDGTGSADAEGPITARLWKQVGGPRVALSDPSSETPEFTAPAAGHETKSLVFRLTVTDGGGLEDSDTCIVKVLPAEAGADAPSTLDGIIDRLEALSHAAKPGHDSGERLEKAGRFLQKAKQFEQEEAAHKALHKLEQALEQCRKALAEEKGAENDETSELAAIVAELEQMLAQRVEKLRAEAEESIGEAASKAGERHRQREVKRARRFYERAQTWLDEGKEMSKAAREFFKARHTALKAITR